MGDFGDVTDLVWQNVEMLLEDNVVRSFFCVYVMCAKLTSFWLVSVQNSDKIKFNIRSYCEMFNTCISLLRHCASESD